MLNVENISQLLGPTVFTLRCRLIQKGLHLKYTPIKPEALSPTYFQVKKRIERLIEIGEIKDREEKSCSQ